MRTRGEKLYLLGMDFDKLHHRQEQFLALTSLYPSEFDLLFKAFLPRWEQWFKHHNFQQKRRAKPLTAKQLARPTTTLPTPEEKLFFVLYLYKTHPLQQTAAATFDMSQAQVSRWKKVLTPLLVRTLRDLDLHAAENTEELIDLFRRRQQQAPVERRAESLHLDATERTIQRNLDYATQKLDYSGKQRVHTIKNSVVCDERQFVHFVGPTWRGAMHDKSMIAEELPGLDHPVFDELWLSKDSGYQGYDPPGVHLLASLKAFRNHPLTPEDQKWNSWVGSIRVVVENAISGIKRLRACAERHRKFLQHRAHQTIRIATGLHNLRVQYRPDSYLKADSCVCANLFSLRV